MKEMELQLVGVVNDNYDLFLFKYKNNKKYFIGYIEENWYENVLYLEDEIPVGFIKNKVLIGFKFRESIADYRDDGIMLLPKIHTIKILEYSLEEVLTLIKFKSEVKYGTG